MIVSKFIALSKTQLCLVVDEKLYFHDTEHRFTQEILKKKRLLDIELFGTEYHQDLLAVTSSWELMVIPLHRLYLLTSFADATRLQMTSIQLGKEITDAPLRIAKIRIIQGQSDNKLITKEHRICIYLNSKKKKEFVSFLCAEKEEWRIRRECVMISPQEELVDFVCTNEFLFAGYREGNTMSVHVAVYSNRIHYYNILGFEKGLIRRVGNEPYSKNVKLGVTNKNTVLILHESGLSFLRTLDFSEAFLECKKSKLQNPKHFHPMYFEANLLPYCQSHDINIWEIINLLDQLIKPKKYLATKMEYIKAIKVLLNFFKIEEIPNTMVTHLGKKTSTNLLFHSIALKNIIDARLHLLQEVRRFLVEFHRHTHAAAGLIGDIDLLRQKLEYVLWFTSKKELAFAPDKSTYLLTKYLNDKSEVAKKQDLISLAIHLHEDKAYSVLKDFLDSSHLERITPLGHHLRGLALFGMGKYDEAEDSFNKALDLCFRGKLSEFEYKLLSKDYKAFLKSKDKRIDYCVFLMYLYEKKSLVEYSIKFAKRARKLDPSFQDKEEAFYLWKARSNPLLKDPNYYELLYLFFLERNLHRKAAQCVFEFAIRLKHEEQGQEQKIKHALLLALTSLKLVAGCSDEMKIDSSSDTLVRHSFRSNPFLTAKYVVKGKHEVVEICDMLELEREISKLYKC